MAFFISSEQRTRTANFEKWQHNTDAAVGHPEVADALGTLGMNIAAANANAFLPNVRHGKVSLPRSRRNTNAAAILLYSNVEREKITLDTGMLKPTLDRRNKIAQHIGGNENGFAQGSANAFASLLIDGHLDTSNPRIKSASTVIQDSKDGAHPFVTSLTDTIDQAFYSSRPLIAVNTDSRVYKASVDIRGAFAADQLSRALDVEATETNSYDHGRFWQLRGLVARATILNTLADPEDVDRVNERNSIDLMSPIAMSQLKRNDLSPDIILGAPALRHPADYFGREAFRNIEQVFVHVEKFAALTQADLT